MNEAEITLETYDLIKENVHQVTGRITQIQPYCEQLKLLNGLDWSFDGLYLKSSPCNIHHPREPEHPDIYAYKVIEVLVARNILSSKGEPDIHEHKWTCRVIASECLLQLDPVKLHEEIREASRLLSEITNCPCPYLYLCELANGDDYRILEEIGCIKAKEFYAYDVAIINYDIDKLRFLKKEKLSLQELRTRYENGDPIFEQNRVDFSVAAEQKISSISTSRFALLTADTAVNASEVAAASVAAIHRGYPGAKQA